MGRRVFAGKEEQFDRLASAYGNAGIERRYSCVPIEWYEAKHGWKERNRIYLEHAVPLIQQAAETVLDRAGLTTTDIDGIVTVSSTGLAVPSLDALLMERMAFRRDTQRLPVFGLGCAGGVLGMSRAAALARAAPGEIWLLLVVELCGLTFRSADTTKSNIIATALFGDGAAAAVVRCETDGPAIDGPAIDGPAIDGWGEHCWPDSLDIMGWRIEDDGFGVQFSRDIPHLIENDFRPALDAFLGRHDVGVDDLGAFLIHPGGAKVLNALEQSLELEAGALVHSRAVLRDYGNMSAATVMFVIERALASGFQGRALISALGPGFTTGFALLQAS